MMEWLSVYSCWKGKVIFKCFDGKNQKLVMDNGLEILWQMKI